MEKKLTIRSTKKELLAALNKEKNNSKILKNAAENYLNNCCDEDEEEYINLHFALKGVYPEKTGSLTFYIKGDSSQDLFKEGDDALLKDFKVLYKNKEIQLTDSIEVYLD